MITGFSLLLTEHCQLTLLFIFAYSLTSLAFKQNKLVTRDEGGGVPGSQELKSGQSNSERIASPEIKKKKKKKVLLAIFLFLCLYYGLFLGLVLILETDQFNLFPSPTR